MSFNQAITLHFTADGLTSFFAPFILSVAALESASEESSGRIELTPKGRAGWLGKKNDPPTNMSGKCRVETVTY